MTFAARVSWRIWEGEDARIGHHVLTWRPLRAGVASAKDLGRVMNAFGLEPTVEELNNMVGGRAGQEQVGGFSPVVTAL